MSTEDRITLHSQRAMDELARARAAQCPNAAKAHLALSALHLDELRALSVRPAV
ncbi:MAG TPA: hypothetical protein VGB65_02675 [Allosphingosinicella sp.]|jgi:hypothetical protein